MVGMLFSMPVALSVLLFELEARALRRGARARERAEMTSGSTAPQTIET